MNDKFIPGSIKLDPEVAAKREKARQEYWESRSSMTIEEMMEEARRKRVRRRHQELLCALGFHKWLATSMYRNYRLLDVCYHCGKTKERKKH